VKRIVLFGSYAYGRPSEDSDVDLLVLMNGSRLDKRAVRVREAIGGGASAGGVPGRSRFLLVRDGLQRAADAGRRGILVI